MIWDWEIDVGAFIRKEVLFQLRSGAAKLGLQFTILADDGGWISTQYLIRVEGAEATIESYKRGCADLVRQLRSNP